MDHVGKILKYNFRQNALVVKEDDSYLLIKFKDGSKICVSKNRFAELDFIDPELNEIINL